ncbi:molybdenum cofactor biosynthesis protein MoaE [Hydrotalea sp.]|uniref:molybdenum cofactor biosynthesis protein MoaE n=1 Tax=Hydrotalea sp. TaxID=2881279 RepID=UPI002605B29B|nr:molybdenum cofactor biosynthesis protein MoaE [Hydrotalea sp.]
MKANTIKDIFVDGSITPQEIAESIAQHATKKNIGAHSIFLGQVRADEKTEGVVQAIEYTTYKDMALEQMHMIREALFEKYELTCMHVYHSLGIVPAGEISLFVFVSAVHRKAAIAACTELVEAIKFQLPVWGKEILVNQNTVWKENH